PSSSRESGARSRFEARRVGDCGHGDRDASCLSRTSPPQPLAILNEIHRGGPAPPAQGTATCDDCQATGRASVRAGTAAPATALHPGETRRGIATHVPREGGTDVRTGTEDDDGHARGRTAGTGDQRLPGATDARGPRHAAARPLAGGIAGP